MSAQVWHLSAFFILLQKSQYLAVCKSWFAYWKLLNSVYGIFYLFCQWFLGGGLQKCLRKVGLLRSSYL